MMLKLTSLIILLSLNLCETFNYKNAKLFRVFPKTQDDLQVLSDFHHNQHFDFLSHLRSNLESVNIVVEMLEEEYFIKILKENSINFQIVIHDIERKLQEEYSSKNISSRSTNNEISFNQYHSHAEMNDYLDLVAKTHSNIAKIETIGFSYQDRALKIIKLSTDPLANKPIIFVDAGMHAAEWISSPVTLYAIQQLVDSTEGVALLDKIDWHILPMINPDGYEYSRRFWTNRLWRKTRSPGFLCAGTDPNRNFDFFWGGEGSSGFECSYVYRGPKAFSEKETRALSNYIKIHKSNIKLYLTFHSFGPSILYPWGYTKTLPEDSAELQTLGEMVAQRIEDYSGRKYKVGSSANALYLAAGASDDWAKGVAGINLSYTIELPPGGFLGFNPPEADILPIVRETWQGLKTFHSYIAKKFNN